MGSDILGYLLENWPAAIWITLGGGIVWLYFSIKSKADKANEKSDEAGKKIESLPCKVHESVQNNILLEIKGINTTFDFMRQSIERLEKTKTPLIQTRSPLTLSENGIVVARNLEMQKMIDENWDSIKNFIQDSDAKNPYDIQQILIQQTAVFPENFISQEDINKIKLYAYKEGDVFLSYANVLAILIRDKYLSEKGVDISDIDKYDRQKIE
jgi:hypothetical protein